MKAIVIRHFGGPEELALEETPVPEPAANEALVRVCAAGVGPWDALIRSGRSGVLQSLPVTPGSDVAGVVERLGPGVSGIEAGDAIFGATNPSFSGGYAQYAVASLASIASKPQSLSFVEAASVPVVAVTAWQMLFDRARLAKDQTVLVHGAAGNVGAYAVQLARWAGARVIAVASVRDAAFVRGLGAAETIDFHTQRFEEEVSSVDVVIDTVGGDVQERSFGVLARGGVLVSSVSPPSPGLAQRYGVRVDFFFVQVPAEQLARIAQLIDAGTLKVDVGAVLGLGEARTAHEMLAGTIPHPRGKIVLDLSREST